MEGDSRAALFEHFESLVNASSKTREDVQDELEELQRQVTFSKDDRLKWYLQRELHLINMRWNVEVEQVVFTSNRVIDARVLLKIDPTFVIVCPTWTIF